MAVDECCGSVVFAEQAAVDVVKPVTRDQPVPAGRTCETLQETMKRTPLPTILSTLHHISDQSLDKLNHYPLSLFPTSILHGHLTQMKCLTKKYTIFLVLNVVSIIGHFL